MTPDKINRSYYPALDGLRGYAIILILLYHNFDFIPLFAYGWIGVDIFFVLSGFLITDILLRTLNQKHYLRNFYIRRVLRIFPVYYSSIILFFLLAPHFSKLAGQYAYYSTHQFFLWTNTQNWLYIFYKRPDYSLFFNHCWSLSVEEQFYLLWPLIILLIKDIKKLILFAFAILIGCIFMRIGSWLYFTNANTNFNFQNFTRFDGLAIGCLMALWKYDRPEWLRKRMIGIFIIILTFHLFVFLVTKTFFPAIPHFRFLAFTDLAAMFGLLVWWGIAGNSPWKKFLLENKILINLGKISYGLYVYHFPILILFRLYLPEKIRGWGLPGDEGDIAISVSAAFFALGVSWISYHFLEKKILALKNRIS